MKEWILALETSGPKASLALAKGERVVAQRDFTSERTQEQDLFEPLNEILNEIASGGSLEVVLVGTGPGSYNGARVGIAAAQAVAQVHGCAVVGICSFEATAKATEEAEVWAVGDARRGSFFILPLREGQASANLELHESEDFLKRLKDFRGTRITFESPDRLPAGTEAEICRATADGLIKAWRGLTPEDQAARMTAEIGAFYLRPPHITPAKA